jgi:hypothetical protein
VIGGDGVLQHPEASCGGRFGPRRYDDCMSGSYRRVFLASALAVALASCTGAAGSPAPAASSSAAGGSGAAPSSPASASGQASTPPLAGQTDTDWGRIWDSLPAGFPAYPGSAPAEEAATGPASAVLAVQGVEAKSIADWMRSKLELATYTTEALSGPLEDGGFVLDSTGPAPGCRVQASIAPLGGLTIVTVRYGAACPKP